MRLLIVLALLGAAAAAPGDPKKMLVCGARQQGVGGAMGTVIKTEAGVQRAVSQWGVCVGAGCGGVGGSARACR